MTDLVFVVSRCPSCNARAVSVREVVSAWAGLQPTDDAGGYEYSGESDVDWDTQAMPAGDAVLMCSHGHTWKSEVDA